LLDDRQTKSRADGQRRHARLLDARLLDGRPLDDGARTSFIGVQSAQHQRPVATVPEDQDMHTFDYTAPAELFPTRSRKGNRPMGYRRFAKAAEAIRFAIEELPPDLLIGAHLEVEEQRFDSDGIRRLYENTDYPLARRATPPAR
jgi:hypothetical protein